MNEINLTNLINVFKVKFLYVFFIFIILFFIGFIIKDYLLIKTNFISDKFNYEINVKIKNFNFNLFKKKCLNNIILYEVCEYKILAQSGNEVLSSISDIIQSSKNLSENLKIKDVEVTNIKTLQNYNYHRHVADLKIVIESDSPLKDSILLENSDKILNKISIQLNDYANEVFIFKIYNFLADKKAFLYEEKILTSRAIQDYEADIEFLKQNKIFLIENKKRVLLIDEIDSTLSYLNTAILLYDYVNFDMNSKVITPAITNYTNTSQMFYYLLFFIAFFINLIFLSFIVIKKK